MQLQRLMVPNFRNLRNFEITFTRSAKDADGNERNFNSHAVIGQNGSGKSNMIEALVTIFRDLDLNQKTDFAYEIDYVCRGHLVKVDGVNDKVQIVDASETASREHPISYLSRNSKKYLPNHVFAYYSGRSERIETIFQQHQQRFYKALLDGNDNLMRRLFYCRAVHSQFVLLAYLLKDDEDCRRVLSDLGIVDLESVLFVLKRPYWFKSDLSEDVLLNGDNRFWYARGIVQQFLNELWKESLAPIDHKETRLLDFRGRKETQELLYLFVPDKNALRRIAGEVGAGEPARFFKYLESTYISDLIDEVRINVRHRDIDGNLNFTQLSEGEQQLLTVLGLMRFTHEDESIFLLDEPDTHLNPIWKHRYFDEINKVVKLQNSTETISSQIIITTHDPLMIGSLRKEQVRILSKRNGEVAVEEPIDHPQGMGFAGLLKSEFFGLRSTLDSETLRRIDERNKLFALGDERTPEQDSKLSLLSDELSDLGFASDFRDPYFELFVKRMAKHTKFHKETLSREEIEEQDKIADRIIDEVMAEDDQE